MTDGPAAESTSFGALNSYALRRRVLAVGVLTLLLFLGTAYTIAWLQVSDAWLLIAMGLLYFLVVRPLMRPVREAVSLRRRLAYAAWLEDHGPR